jgi:hypothetical protein
MYWYGKGCELDLERAFNLFNQAHDQGNTDATALLAEMYPEGEGCEQHIGKALDLHMQGQSKEQGRLRVSAQGGTCSSGREQREPEVAERRVDPSEGTKLALSAYHFPAVDDLEAGLAASLAESEAAAGNSQVVDSIFRHKGSVLPSLVYLLEYDRNPSAFFDALEQNPELVKCQEALQKRGLPTTLGNKTRIYVPPVYFESVRAAVRTLDLQPRHIVVVEDLKDLVVGLMASLPRNRSRGTVLKNEKVFNLHIPSSLPSSSSGPASTVYMHPDGGRSNWIGDPTDEPARKCLRKS